ncbi:MAG: ParB/RepB/Spo0J family partition protein [Gemmatimonadetes bacterium]|nr:ParB/RepB/Spo0J family partition protein [Gemmatimonadota bacterium]
MARPPRFDPALAKQRLRQQREAHSAPGAHPARAVDGPRTSTDHLVLDPAEIVLEGSYVRRHVDEEELDSLRKSIVAGGEVKQAIGVRQEGTPLEPRYILVYGMRRWLASKAAGLSRIPVRNHGRISVSESLSLQVTENEARVDPHPVDTAVSYQLLVTEGGLSQAEIARIAGRSPAHVSYMRAVGEAILELDEEERDALCRSRDATVPRFQKIAPLRSIEDRVAALRELFEETAASTPGQPRARPSFQAALDRRSGAWSVKLSYRDEDLVRDPEIASKLELFLEGQLARLREKIRPPAASDAPRRPVVWEIDSPT